MGTADIADGADVSAGLRITSGWCLENAQALLEASAWTYAHPCELVTPLCHAQVFDKGTAVVVAFRGSASARDWLTDCEFPLQDTTAGEAIHHGFLDALISISKPLIAAVEAKVPPTGRGCRGKGMFVTGHSLGGAMAVLGAQALRRAGVIVDAVYTFGGPRVGNRKWARQYDFLLGSMTWRVVNEEDIVPRMPGPLAYRHVGQEVFLPATGNGLVINPGLLRKGWSDLVGTVKGWAQGKVGELADHHIDAYRLRIADCGIQTASSNQPKANNAGTGDQ